MKHSGTALRILAGALLLGGLGLTADRAHAAGTVDTYKVTTPKDDPDAVSCNATGFGPTGNNCSLRGAISLANEQGGPSIARIIVPAFHIVLMNGTLSIDAVSNETVNIIGSSETATLVDDNSQGDQIFAVDTPATFTNMTIENGGSSDSSLDGAGVDVEASTTFSRVAFVNNNAGTGGDGGGIYTDSGYPLSISNSVFRNNFAENGGAIYNDDAYITILSTTFTNNDACEADPCDSGDESGDGSDEGGAIYNDNHMNINLSTFTGNQAGSLISDAGSGGAIYNDDFLQASASHFTSNVAGYEGGAFYNDDYTSVNNSTLGQNVSGEYGGAIEEDDYGFYAGDTFTGNTTGGTVSGYDGNGGGIYVNYWVAISNSTFTANKALNGTPSSPGTGARPLHVGPHGHTTARTVSPQLVQDPCGGYGGGLYINDHTTLSNVHFTSNSACDGGGLYTDDYSYPLGINGSSFVSNTATFDGGGLYVDGSPPNTVLHDTQVVSNHAGNMTGGVFNTDEGDVIFGGTTRLLGNSGGSCPNLTLPCS